MELYKWQKDCLNKWEKNNGQGIVNAITGSGKTMLAIEAMDRMIEKYPELRIRIVAPTIALANQWRQAILRAEHMNGTHAGFYGDGLQSDGDQRVIIYVVNSAREALEKHMRADFALKRHVLLICDECHRYRSKENFKIFRFVTGDICAMDLYLCMGLSATPFPDGQEDKLSSVLGREIYRYGFADAKKHGTISDFAVCQVAVDFLSGERAEYMQLSEQIGAALKRLLKSYPYLKELSEVKFMKEVRRLADESGMDGSDPASMFLLSTFQRKKITVLADARIRCCIDLLNQFSGRERILIFCERIDQAQKIYQQIMRRFGSVAGIYHSDMTKEARKRVLQEFRNRQTRILVSCRCLDEGLDVPDAGIGIVISSSAVPRQRIQRLGRIIRRSEGKDMACLYYMYIRESSEDKAYLYGLDQCETFDLRYMSEEQAFTNDLYEYAAIELIKRVKKARMNEKEEKEIRRCLIEGLCRADYLLPDKILQEMIHSSEDIRKKNYYRIMKKIGQSYCL